MMIDHRLAGHVPKKMINMIKMVRIRRRKTIATATMAAGKAVQTCTEQPTVAT